MKRLFGLEMCYLCNTTGDKTLNSELSGHDSTLVSSSPIFFQRQKYPPKQGDVFQPSWFCSA